MENVILKLSISDYIQLMGVLASLITSIVAIVISVKTLRQNNYMMEDASRPYVVIYSGMTNFQNPSYYIIITRACSTNKELSIISYTLQDIAEKML